MHASFCLLGAFSEECVAKLVYGPLILKENGLTLNAVMWFSKKRQTAIPLYDNNN